MTLLYDREHVYENFGAVWFRVCHACRYVPIDKLCAGCNDRNAIDMSRPMVWRTSQFQYRPLLAQPDEERDG